MKAIYDMQIKGIGGEEMDLQQYAGKKMIIVNVASACGFTPQYAQLQELYEHYKSTLEVIGCPCNDFGHQEPGSPQEISDFCNINYGVNFPLTEKISILENPHPLYQFLGHKSINGNIDAKVNWNFCKFLVDADGYVNHFYSSAVSPLDNAIISWIEA